MVDNFWSDAACQIFAQAAIHGHLHIIRWLREQELPGPWNPQWPHEYAFSAAADYCHLNIMRWLYENGFPWNQQYGTQYMQTAAFLGDLRALEWAQCQHPPFVMDETVCGASTYLSVLKWLRTRHPPCPWDDSDRDHAHRAIFIQEHLMRCGLTREVAVLITDIVCKIEIDG